MDKREKIEFPGENFYAEFTHEDETKILVAFRNNHPFDALKDEDRKRIIEDIKDLGKWRIYKKLKKDLEDENG